MSYRGLALAQEQEEKIERTPACQNGMWSRLSPRTSDSRFKVDRSHIGHSISMFWWILRFIRIRLPYIRKQTEAVIVVVQRSLPIYQKWRISVDAILTNSGWGYFGNEALPYKLFLQLADIEN